MDADVIVIGAGIVGAACAHELAHAGLDVLVLDDRRGGATAAGMGHLVVMDDNPAELALSRHSLTLWRQWAGAMAADCAWHPCGTLWLAANDEEMAAAHLESLRSIQPEGPYLLGSFCGASVIAYEMAQQLRAQGQAVDLLVFFEPMAGPIELSRLAGRLIRRIGVHADDRLSFIIDVNMLDPNLRFAAS